MRGELLETADKLGVRDRVHLIGFCRNVFDFLKSSDIFCFPSTREGMPVSLMEAMGAELPAVVSNVRGNRDLIVPGKGGFLYDPYDEDGFANGIKAMVDDPALRKSMGAFNKERIQDFDIKIAKKCFAGIYFGDK